MTNDNVKNMIYKDEDDEVAWIKEECDLILQAAFAKLDEMVENNNDVFSGEIEVTVDIT